VLLSLFATLPADFVGCRGCLEMDNFIMPFMGHTLTLTRVVQNPQPSLDREPAGGRQGTGANRELTASCWSESTAQEMLARQLFSAGIDCVSLLHQQYNSLS